MKRNHQKEKRGKLTITVESLYSIHVRYMLFLDILKFTDAIRNVISTPNNTPMQSWFYDPDTDKKSNQNISNEATDNIPLSQLVKSTAKNMNKKTTRNDKSKDMQQKNKKSEEMNTTNSSKMDSSMKIVIDLSTPKPPNLETHNFRMKPMVQKKRKKHGYTQYSPKQLTAMKQFLNQHKWKPLTYINSNQLNQFLHDIKITHQQFKVFRNNHRNDNRNATKNST